MKKLTKKMIEDFESKTTFLLRSCLKAHGYFPPNDPDYAQAYGIKQGLHIAGYGSDNHGCNMSGKDLGFAQEEQGLSWWFNKIMDKVQEDYKTS